MLIKCVHYVDGRKVSASGDTDYQAMYAAAKSQGGFVWLGTLDPDAQEISELAEVFNLHELAAEDAVHALQRPKLDDFGDLEFVTLKTLYYDDVSSQVETGDFMIYLGKQFVLTVRHGQGVALNDVRSQLEKDEERLAHGPYAVLHAVMDRLVDSYTNIVYELDNDVTNLEGKVFDSTRKSWSQDLYFLKREVIEFRRAVEPLKPILRQLVADQNLNIPIAIRPFFRDVEDHVNRAAELSASHDQLLSAAIQADLAQVQLMQNEDMRKISAFAALAAVPTMVAGIYGMNFDDMPELHSAWGYPMALSVMAAVSGWLFWRFKKSGWL